MQRRHHVRATLAVGLALMASLLCAPGALAHTAQFSSSHTLTFARGSTGDVFSGQVSSDLAACTEKRSITLYRVATEAGSADAAVATTSADSSGAWSTTFTQATGDYYAVAVKTVLPTRRQHHHTCMAATSNIVTAPPRDGDGDGVYDASDNCPNAANADQKNTDGDGYGDVCDPDADGDGYTPSQGDCNDLKASVNPGATELANAIDDDCDGVIDEGFGATQTCWVPSSEPITAETTWSQVGLAGPCSWWMRIYSSTSPDSVFMDSVEWMNEYRLATEGQPVAFQYGGKSWTYYATYPNGVVCTCDGWSDGGEGF
jgi:hypothetical protein